MKKIVSALLIFLLFFNWFGYNLVVNYLQQKADVNMEAMLDTNQYEDAQLIELKIPTNIPYQTSWASYERYDGEVKLNGAIFKYVKRKVANDTLYLMCIPNTKKMQLETVRDDFFKNTNDLAQNNHSGKSSKSSSFKNGMSEYDDHSFIYTLAVNYKVADKLDLPYKAAALFSAPHLSPAQPPDGGFA
ncbi:MAG: hypothetical protein ABJA37_03380 [Ferruginibacter sp.]